jgi:signal transduction histidine kinase
MQFNTALCFLLSSMGLFLLFRRAYVAVKVVSGALIFLGGLSGLQYIIGANFGIDELFMEAYILVKTSHPGRMAPNTALSFVVMGCSLLTLRHYLEASRFERLSCALSGTVFVLGSIPFIGYIMGIETAYGWGYLTRMAVHTSLCFVVLSVGLLGVLIKSKDDPLIERKWLPIFSGYLILIVGVFIWSGLHHYQIESLKEMVSYERLFLKHHIQKELDKPIQELWQEGSEANNIVQFDPSRVGILFEEILYKALESRYNLTVLYDGAVVYEYVNPSKGLPNYTQFFEVDHGNVQFEIRIMPVESLITKFNTSFIPLFSLSIFVVIAVLIFWLIQYIQKSVMSNKELYKLNQMSLQHVDNLTGVLTNIANLDFSEKAEITGASKRFDTIAEQVNLVSEQLAMALTKMDEKNRLLGHMNEELKQRAEDVDAQRLAALNIAADIREMLEKTERAEQAAREQAIQLEQSNNSLQEFARIVSHDLQEPLRKVLMYSDKIQTGVQDSGNQKLDAYIEKMNSATTRMQQLISDILHYSRVTSFDVEMESVDIAKLVQEVVDDLEVRIAESNSVIKTQLSGSVSTNRILLKQLIQNLVGNALKFHKPDSAPEVLISGGPQHDHYHFSVKDNGVGFEQEQSERIFEIFQRLHPKGEYKGTGIGLTICKKIIQRLGGDIMTKSEPGKGAEFTVSLPLGGQETKGALVNKHD